MIFDETIKKSGKENHVPISFDETLTFLIKTIKKYNCKEILEIGTAIAYGSISMAENSNLKHIDTLEINEESFNIAKNNIISHNLDNKITCYNIDAKDYIANCNKSYDLIYMDGPKGQYINYLEECINLLKPNGIIVADNIFFHGMVLGTEQVSKGCKSMISGLHKFVEAILTDKRLDSKILNIGDGVALIKKI